MTKLKKSNGDKTQKIRLWQNAKTLIITVVKVTIVTVEVVTVAIVTSLEKITWHLNNWRDFLGAAICNSRDVLLIT